jgi:tRNA(fMet)-specific endonuclease VapC
MLLIDTDICSYAIKSRQSIAARLSSIDPATWAISAITHHELSYGANLPGVAKQLVDRVERFLASVNTLDFDMAAATSAGLVRVELRQKGLASGLFDELIAGHAISIGAKLVTNNSKHFSNITGLSIETWS